jgi:hypothetical protein
VISDQDLLIGNRRSEIASPIFLAQRHHRRSTGRIEEQRCVHLELLGGRQIHAGNPSSSVKSQSTRDPIAWFASVVCRGGQNAATRAAAASTGKELAAAAGEKHSGRSQLVQETSVGNRGRQVSCSTCCNDPVEVFALDQQPAARPRSRHAGCGKDPRLDQVPNGVFAAVHLCGNLFDGQHRLGATGKMPVDAGQFLLLAFASFQHFRENAQGICLTPFDSL